jgi:hypothetical protein
MKTKKIEIKDKRTFDNNRNDSKIVHQKLIKCVDRK